MKNIFKVILPVLVFTLASAAAVNTHSAKVKETKNPVAIFGYIQNPTPSKCVEVSVNCTTTNTGQNCMSSEATPRRVWEKNEANACTENLYKVL